MQLQVKKDENSLVIQNSKRKIERYNQFESIDFKELIKELIVLELQEKIELEIDNFTKNEQEEQLISLLSEIVNKYNERVDEYMEFLKKVNNNN